MILKFDVSKFEKSINIIELQYEKYILDTIVSHFIITIFVSFLDDILT